MLPHDDTVPFEVLEEQHSPSNGPTSPATAPPLVTMKPDSLPPTQQSKIQVASAFLPIRNQFQEQFMAPIRKRSTVSEDFFWEETEQFPIQEIHSDQQVLGQDPSDTPQGSQDLPHVNTQFFSQSKDEENTSELAEEFQELCDIDSKSYQEETIRNVVQVVHVRYQNGNFYWFVGSLIQVNLESIQMLYDTLLDKKCFLPLFNQQLYIKWSNLSKQQKTQPFLFPYLVLQCYLQEYTSFLSQHYHNELVASLIFIKHSQQTTPISNNNKTESYFKKIGVSSILSGLNPFNTSSRTEILRKSVLKKLESLAETRKQCQELRLLHEVKKLTEIESYNWKMLGNLDLLLSLEETTRYCDKRSETSSDDKTRQFWINYRTSIHLNIQQYMKNSLPDILI